MKKITLIVIVLFASVTAFFFFTRESVADACEGRCTGSSNCSACSNCSRCKHCNSGGSCGVCSSGSRSRSDNYSSSPSISPSESKKYTIEPSLNNNTPTYTSSESSTNSSSKEVTVKHKSSIRTYYVKSTMLNIRKEASKTSEIICVVKKKNKIKILKSHDDYWYYVESVCSGKKVKGFVSKGSIIK